MPLSFLCDQLVSNRTVLICLFEPWWRLPCASLASPRRAGRRIRVGLPTPDKLQMTARRALLECSLSSTNGNHPRAASHCLNNRIHQTNHRGLVGPVPAFWPSCPRCSDARCASGTRHCHAKTPHRGKMPQMVHQHTAKLRQTQVCCLLYVRSAIQPGRSTTSTVG